MRKLIIPVLIIAFFIFLAVAPASAAVQTHNVSTTSQLYNVSKLTLTTSGLDLVINVNGNLTADITTPIEFRNCTAVINGNGNQLKLNPDGMPMGDNASLKINNSTVTFNRLNFNNTMSSRNESGSSECVIFMKNEPNVTFDSCIFNNNTLKNSNASGYSRGFIYFTHEVHETGGYVLDDILPVGEWNLTFRNCTISNHTGRFLEVNVDDSVDTIDDRHAKVSIIDSKFQYCLMSSVDRNGGPFVAVFADELIIENITVSDCMFSVEDNGPSIRFLDVYMDNLGGRATITNCTLENNVFSTGTYMMVLSQGITLKNCYFGNISVVDVLFQTYPNYYASWNLEDECFIIQNTFENISGVRIFKPRTGDITHTVYHYYFNTFVNSNFSNNPQWYNNSTQAEFLGNLYVGCSNAADSGGVFTTYPLAFGTNVSKLNGGKTKTIELRKADDNPAMEKISSSKYIELLKTNPSNDKDANSAKRLQGKAVEAGSVESSHTFIDVIKDIIGGGGNNSINNSTDNNSTSGNNIGNSRPSTVLYNFVFGDGSIVKRTSSLLYYIMNNWVKVNIVGISQLSQIGINLLRLTP
ncbi:hypothetical protein [Methanolapillus millepedarum]|uniref:Uncharacterized protein n=1 Tax=Methanolapillus millepedarum TaxID=3028296 RepID=A0AA96V3M8_9EURY|nr:hypothetical protein MsAc7_06930 [Methanosarcinaceae archaeon Ac7]